jgi:hypothetical protein
MNDMIKPCIPTPRSVADLRLCLQHAVSAAEVALGCSETNLWHATLSAFVALLDAIEAVEASRDSFFDISPEDRHDLMELARRAILLLRWFLYVHDAVAGPNEIPMRETSLPSTTDGGEHEPHRLN